MLIGLFGLLLLYCLCATASVALRRSRPARLREIADSGRFGGGMALQVLGATDRHQVALQVTSFISTVLSGALFLYWVPELFSTEAPEFIIWLGELAYLLGFIFAGLTLSQLGRAMAYRMPEKVLCRLGWFVVSVGNLFYPFVRLLSGAVDRVLSWWKVPMPTEHELAASPEEISEIVERSSEAGAIDPAESELIQGVFAFSDTVVREVMTPRREIVSIGIDESIEGIVAVLSKEGVSRLLVTGETIDEIKGVVLAKDLLPVLVSDRRSDCQLTTLLRTAYIVPESKKVDELLGEFRRKGVHFAVVLNELGSVSGVVTLEDLLEELVGEIVDEHDRPGSEIKVRKTKSGDLLVSGAALVDDLNSQFNLSIPVGEYDTLGGYLINCLGRIPQPGDLLERNGLRFRVEEVAQKRISLVRIHNDKRMVGLSDELPASPAVESVTPVKVA